mgnify:CR=1 FL=1
MSKILFGNKDLQIEGIKDLHSFYMLFFVLALMTYNIFRHDFSCFSKDLQAIFS